MRAVHLSILTILSVTGALSQTTVDNWTTLTTRDGAFSVDMPSNFISFIDSERDEVKILGSRQNSTFFVTVRQTKGGNSMIAASRNRLKTDGYKLQSFVIGKNNVDVYTSEKGINRYIFEIASESAYYNINVATRSANDADTERFLTSCKLNGKVFMWNSSVVILDSEKEIYIGDLTTSPVFTESLEHKQTSKIPVIKKWNIDAESPDTIFYSRPLMILKREAVRYTNIARDISIRGEVILSIVFKGDGDIGEIRVVKGLGGGLTEESVNSAKKIKFLPAIIDGKPADVTRTITYGFGIY